MAPYLLRMEGVNFAATLYDTADLSTIRGSGLALLDAPEQVIAKSCSTKLERVFSGASQAVFRFEAADEKQAEQAAEEVRKALATENPYKYLSFVVDVVPYSDKSALANAEARNRARQFRQWTLDIPEFSLGATGYDERDMIRPTTKSEVSSPSVASRREFGRKMRQEFYQKEVGGILDDVNNMYFSDSFEEIVGNNHDELINLPPSLQQKMAVVYADGNKFGRLKGTTFQGNKNFSDDLSDKRKKLLASVLDCYRKGMAEPAQKALFAIDNSGREKLRFETLLWGGDEFMFVMPSWLAFSFVDHLFRHTRDWTTRDEPGQKLTYSVGLVICHHKTPIRQAKSIAEQLAHGCKEVLPDDAQKNAVSFAIFESHSPFDTELGPYRARLFNVSTDAHQKKLEQEKKLKQELALPGDQFSDLIRVIAQAKDEENGGLPRSQIYKLLRIVRANGGYFSEEALQKAADELDRYRERAEGRCGKPAKDLKLPVLCGGARRLVFDLALMAEFWDYVDPFQSEAQSLAEEADGQ